MALGDRVPGVLVGPARHRRTGGRRVDGERSADLFPFRVPRHRRGTTGVVHVASKPVAALGTLGVALIAGSSRSSSEAVLLLFASVLILLLLRTARPMIDEVRSEFTR